MRSNQSDSSKVFYELSRANHSYVFKRCRKVQCSAKDFCIQAQKNLKVMQIKCSQNSALKPNSVLISIYSHALRFTLRSVFCVLMVRHVSIICTERKKSAEAYWMLLIELHRLIGSIFFCCTFVVAGFREFCMICIFAESVEKV